MRMCQEVEVVNGVLQSVCISLENAMRRSKYQIISASSVCFFFINVCFFCLLLLSGSKFAIAQSNQTLPQIFTPILNTDPKVEERETATESSVKPIEVRSVLTETSQAETLKQLQPFTPASSEIDPSSIVKANKSSPLRDGQTQEKQRDDLMLRIPGGGVVWLTEDPAMIQPSLSLSLDRFMTVKDGQIQNTLSVNYATNYPEFIDTLAIHFYLDSSHQSDQLIAQVPVPITTKGQIDWAGEDWLSSYKPKAGQRLKVSLRATDANGNIDETVFARLDLVMPDSDSFDQSTAKTLSAFDKPEAIVTGLKPQDPAPKMAQSKRLEFAQQSIPVSGSRVRVFGRDIADNADLSINGDPVSIDRQRKFTYEQLLPVGKHEFLLSLSDQQQRLEHRLTIDVSGQYLFFVGLADLSISESHVSGSVEPLSVTDNPEDILIDGRLAFYAKGKLKGKYLITAQADTQEKPIEHLFDGFFDTEPQDIFRRLDPDKYYLVYGDDSTSKEDVNTQGKLYLRVDWDQNQALWGSYKTGFTESDIAQYKRSLYGVAVDLHSQEGHTHGGPKQRIKAFASDAETAQGHNEFRGTGGSLYYLRHQDLLPGSDSVELALMDSTTGLVLSRTELSSNADYDIDYFQGRILLNRPLASYAGQSAGTLITDQAVNDQYYQLIVDYEYIPDRVSEKNLNLGVQGKRWLTDKLSLGTTLVEERQAGDDYRLQQIASDYQIDENSLLRFELSQSKAFQAATFESEDGGLSFTELTPNVIDKKGNAFALSADIDLYEIGLSTQQSQLISWWKQSDAGYRSSSRNFKADAHEKGLQWIQPVSTRLNLITQINEVKRGEELNQKNLGVLAQYQLSDQNRVNTELRHSDEKDKNSDGKAMLAAVQLIRQVNSQWTLKSTAQATLDQQGEFKRNDRLTVGADYQATQSTGLGLAVSSGNRGDAAHLTSDWQLNDKHSIYTRYTAADDQDSHSLDPTWGDQGLTLGHRASLSKTTSVFNESKLTEQQKNNSLSHTFGLDFDFEGGWYSGLSTQYSEIENSAKEGLIRRNSSSASYGYRSSALNWASKLEFREDRGVEIREQWVTTNRLDWRANTDLKLSTKINYARTDEHDEKAKDSQLVEAGIGAAFRPAQSQKLEWLGKWNYLYDLPSAAQSSDLSDKRSHIFSLEGIYQAHKKWTYSAKLATRKAELRENRGSGGWFRSDADFSALQARYHAIKKWDGLLEWRQLKVSNDHSRRQGWLMGIDRHVGQNLKLGIGYNFTDFSDDLNEYDYQASGWYLNLLGKF